MTDLKEILVVGLGAGSFAQLTLGVWEILKNSELLYLRTAKHPMVDDLSKRGIKFRTFDYLYEEKDDFEKIYEGIAEELLLRIKEAEPPVEQLVYAVPGHPLVGEKSVRLLLEKAAGDGRGEVRVLKGSALWIACLIFCRLNLTARFYDFRCLKLYESSFKSKSSSDFYASLQSFCCFGIKADLVGTLSTRSPGEGDQGSRHSRTGRISSGNTV